MSSRLPIVLLVVLGLSSPLRGDDVYLTNGKVYEGVLAEREGDSVRIRLSFGSLGIPASQVDRIVKAEAPLQVLLRRERALLEDETSSAESWLDLARWAEARGFVSAVREAALRAAELDPELPALGSILRPAGFRYDEELQRWIPLAEYMARRGFVRFEGEWISRETQQELIRQARAERREAEERESARRLRRATEELARAATLQALAETRRSEPATVVVAPSSGFVAPGFGVPALVGPVRPDRHPRDRDVKPPRKRPDHRPHTRRAHHTGTFRDLMDRQPGSFIPVRSSRPGAGHHRDSGHRSTPSADK